MLLHVVPVGKRLVDQLDRFGWFDLFDWFDQV
jgi:hypothetical protein